MKNTIKAGSVAAMMLAVLAVPGVCVSFEELGTGVNAKIAEVEVPQSVSVEKVSQKANSQHELQFVLKNYNKIDAEATKRLKQNGRQFNPKNWVLSYKDVLDDFVEYADYGEPVPLFDVEAMIEIIGPYPSEESAITLISIHRCLYEIYEKAAQKFPKDFESFTKLVEPTINEIKSGVRKAKTLSQMRKASYLGSM